MRTLFVLTSRRHQQRAVTLTELLCVIAMIAILSAFYLPTVVRAFVRVKKFLMSLQ